MAKGIKMLPLRLEPVTKADVTRFFKALRQAGFFARQSYWCCNSCGCAALSEDMKPSQTKWVFYNRQDAASWSKAWDRTELADSLYLTYGNLDGKHVERVGKEIEQIATDCGLSVYWDGKGTTRIKILPERVHIK